ncbi:DUF4192 domain-containing protein [Sinomonas humi]|uniref:DUF4192 domain-containing protein n=1 Tax=Sinomonas humi TaxID=1338436 RepID=A0A0B2AML0_9MICC|nr:DUF4192 domain-containing protein [Sinomonas humi]KHL03094.1 hypothetical protein LK10_09925 [Sinomonas humi]
MDESNEHFPTASQPDRCDVLSVREPEDLLGYIPHALGEWPQESLVAITLGAGSVGVSVRVDLPGALEPDELECFAGTVAEYLITDPLADSAVLALYSAVEWRDINVPPHGAAVTAVRAALADLGIPLLDAWLVGEHTWRSLLCDQTECCPWPGQSVETIRASRVNAELVYRGSAFGAEPEAGPRASAERAQTPAQVGPRRESEEDWWAPGQFAAALAVWDEALSTGRIPTDERLRLLAASLVRPALRDAVIVGAALGGSAAWHGSRAIGVLDSSPRGAAVGAPALAGGLSSEEVSARVGTWEEQQETESTEIDAALEFGAVILGQTRERPQWERIERLERIMRLLVEREEPEIRAPALAVLGWICWARGRGSKAAGFLRRSLSAIPGYRFADLLARVIDRGDLAGWARSPETAWRRMGEAA